MFILSVHLIFYIILSLIWCPHGDLGYNWSLAPLVLCKRWQMGTNLYAGFVESWKILERNWHHGNLAKMKKSSKLKKISWKVMDWSNSSPVIDSTHLFSNIFSFSRNSVGDTRIIKVEGRSEVSLCPHHRINLFRPMNYSTLSQHLFKFPQCIFI